jgi:uncharacterized membrane protein SirB2
MHAEYWVAIGLYVVAVVLTALPFLGIVTIELDLEYATLKFLHILFVFLAVSVLIGQLITYNVMQHAKITTQAALEYLSLLDHTIPVFLVIIGVLGHSMAAHYGPIWEVPWIHESAFGLLMYAAVGLVMTMIFRRVRFQQEGGTQSSAGVYIASGIGVVFLLFMSAIMVYKQVPMATAHHFTPIAKYFAGE